MSGEVPGPRDDPGGSEPSGATVGRGIDLRTALVLSAAYGVTGAIAALLLLPALSRTQLIELPMPAPAFAAILAVQLTVVYGLLGWAGLRLARARGREAAPMLTALWQRRSSPGAARGLVHALTVGAGMGLVLVGAVRGISALFPGTLPTMLHPPGALAALAAGTAGAIGEEILSRLVVVSLVLRLAPVGARWAGPAAVLTGALVFGLLHTPAMVALWGGLENVPRLAWAWIIGLNALAGVVFGGVFLQRGIGGAIAAHGCCNLVWHVGSTLA